MSKLHNKVNGEILKKRMQESTEPRLTLSFYRYAKIEDTESFRDRLYHEWEQLGVMGRTYVAHEGVNAQISMPTAQLEAFRKQLYGLPGFDQTRLNIAYEDDGKSFFKLKIKVRPKILADGLNDETFDVTDKGTHLNAEEFNQLTDREDSLLIDMRNHYESEVGHFDGAVCPDVDTFRDSLPIIEEMLDEHRDKHIVMYCTGGIRCEKASAYFKHKGFEKVYQLEGGIIKYAHDVKEQELPNKFKGKNFVFDERLGERITEEIISQCHQCDNPSDSHTNCSNLTCNLLFIQCETCAKAHEGCCSPECQEYIHLPAEEQERLRKGQDSGIRIFSKGRFKKS